MGMAPVMGNSCIEGTTLNRRFAATGATFESGFALRLILDGRQAHLK